MDRLMSLTKAEHRQLHHDLRAGRGTQDLAIQYGVRQETIQYHQKACAARDARFDMDPKDILINERESIR